MLYAGMHGDAAIARGITVASALDYSVGNTKFRNMLALRPLLERGDDLAQITRRGAAHGQLASASVHPQSTCRMGADPASSVVGSYGECHDVEGLFVADMSVFPTSLGAPPQITTAMFADRTAHHLLQNWRRFQA